MANEIERKFIVNKEKWLLSCHHCPAYTNTKGISQGYLFNVRNHVVRIRTVSDGTAKFTYKGPLRGITRTEIEFSIPYFFAKLLLKTANKVIHKTRTTASYKGLTWEVDEFHNLHKELFLAEVELESEDQEFTIPDWIEREVSDDPLYYNSVLITQVQ